MRASRTRSLVVCAATLVFGLALLPAAVAQPADLFSGPEREWAEQEVARLAKIQAEHENGILRLPGVLGMGVGVDPETKEMLFEVLVDDKEEMPALPLAIEGIPIRVERSSPPVALHGGSGCVPCHATQQSLPVPMGNSGFGELFCSACTLGFKACYRPTNTKVYVTNAHCSTDSNGCEGGAPIGSDTLHRSLLDAACVRTTDIGDVAAHATPNCGGNNIVDAARITSSNSLTGWSIRDIGTPSVLSATVAPGDTVQKSGRTTGHTFGTVGATNYTVNVGGYCCGTATFVGQIRVNATTAPFILGGDSGSALLNTQSPPKIVGLLFAGNPPSGTLGFANTIYNVTRALNLSLTTSCSCKPAYSTCFSDSECCSWNCYSIPGGGGLRLCV